MISLLPTRLCVIWWIWFLITPGLQRAEWNSFTKNKQCQKNPFGTMPSPRQVRATLRSVLSHCGVFPRAAGLGTHPRAGKQRAESPEGLKAELLQVSNYARNMLSSWPQNSSSVPAWPLIAVGLGSAVKQGRESCNTFSQEMQKECCTLYVMIP